MNLPTPRVDNEATLARYIADKDSEAFVLRIEDARELEREYIRVRRALDQVGFLCAGGNVDNDRAKHIAARVIAVLRDGQTFDGLQIQPHHAA